MKYLMMLLLLTFAIGPTMLQTSQDVVVADTVINAPPFNDEGPGGGDGKEG